MFYFEKEIERLTELIEVPLMTRRLSQHKEDPLEELIEVYNDVKDIEGNLQKTINIANFMISKNKELFEENYELSDELEILEMERQTLDE